MLAALVPPLATLALLLVVQALAVRTTAALVRLAGWHAIPFTTGWLGVPVHEGSHLLACLLLGRRVRQVRWFAPDSSSGTLGQVSWEPGRPPFSWLAALLVGLAPLAFGTAVLQGLARLAALVAGRELAVLPATSLFEWGQGLARWLQLAVDLTTHSWSRGGTSRALVLLGWYGSACIAAHLTPSRADLAGTWRGLIVIAILSSLALVAARAAQLPVQALLLHALALGAAWVAPGLLLALVALLLLWLAASGLAVILRRP